MWVHYFVDGSAPLYIFPGCMEIGNVDSVVSLYSTALAFPTTSNGDWLALCV